MAIDFEASSSQYLITDGTGIQVSFPLTLAAWCKSESPASATAQTIFNIRNTASGQKDRCRLVVFGSSGLAGCNVYDATTAENTSSNTTWDNSTGWQHVAGTINASGQPLGYVNGSAGTRDTGTTPASGGLDLLEIGATNFNAGQSQFFDGQIAEVGLWTVELNAAEIAALNRGVPPYLIRPQSLALYIPMRTLGQTEDLPFNGRDVSGIRLSGVSGPVTGNSHPPMMRLYNNDLLIGSTTSTAGEYTPGGEVPGPGGGPTVVPYGHHLLDRQYAAIAAARLGGVLQ